MSFDDDILIDNYFRGDLTEKQVLDFEARLKTDAAFRENYELEKTLRLSQNDNNWEFISKPNKEFHDYKNILESNEIQNLKSNLKKIDSSFLTKGKNNFNRFIYLALAACILLFLFFQLSNFGNVNNIDLYDAYLNVTDVPSLSSRGVEDDLVKAERLFLDSKYEDALKILDSNSTNLVNNSTVLIFKGISQLELGKLKKAENTFNILIKSDLIDAEKGYWYKALVMLKSGDIYKTKEILRQIISNSYYKSKEAKSLLNDLQRLN